MMKQFRRFGANFMIVIFVGMIMIDGLPTISRAHQRLRDAIDPFLDASGLWQGSWNLFAPEPDSINSRISARIQFNDGTTEQWNSPDWSNTSPWQRFTDFRQMEYFDRLRMDNNGAAMGPFAEYLANTVESPGQPSAIAVRVQLTRHWVNILPPDESRPLMPIGGDWTHSGSSVFYTWMAP